MTTGLVHAFDDICDYGATLYRSGKCFLRYLSDQSVMSLASESKEKEVGKLKKVLSQEKTKSEKLEITLKHVRARLDEQFWLREQAEMKMKQMQEEVGRVSCMVTYLVDWNVAIQFHLFLLPKGYVSLGQEILF